MSSMEPVDVLEIKKQMEQNCTVGNFLKKPGCVVNTVTMVGFQAASLTTPNVPFDLLCLLVSGYNLFKLFRKWDRHKNIYTRLALKLENTPVYSRMCENYFTYLHKLAQFLRKFEIKDTKELLCLLEILMKEGYYSYDFSHEYHKYKHNTGEMSGTTGAHVVTGKCVCRHMASFFSDLLYKCKIDSCNISARVRYEDEVKEFLKGRKQEFNHAVVGIVEDDSRFIFDPTNDVFVGSSDTKFRGFKMNDVGQTILKGHNTYVFTAEAESLWMNKLHLEEYKKYKNAKMEELDIAKITEFRRKAMALYVKNKAEFDSFYKSMAGLLKEIHDDLIMLSPKSDEEIKEWVLKY